MNKLTDENCREQFEEWFADHAGQTVAWVKSQRASDTHYKIGPEIQRYWLTWQASRETLEIALPILEQQERGEGDWIEWTGGKRPVISDKQVEVKFRGGEGCIALSGELDWRDTESCGDIIAYRIIPEREESCSN
jgi:hypothetical protein